MPIDYSMYSQMQAPDIMGGIEKGMRMSDMIKERKQKQALQDAYQAGNVVGPDGKTTFDPEKAASAASLSGLGQQAQDIRRQAQADKAQQFEMQAKKMDMIGGALDGITPQNYGQRRQGLISTGLFSDEDIPQDWDEGFIQSHQQASDRWKNRQHQQKQLDMQEKDLAIRRQERAEDRADARYKADREFGAKESEIAAKKAMGEYLPMDAKKTVEGLSTKNASKISIKNQIDSVMNGWDNLDDDQKVAAGRQLLKTLNSTEGADAIGVEEAARLGSKLEFAMGNLFNSNPTQFGRDLDGFAEQARNTSTAIDEAVKSNQSVIDQTMGRSPQQTSKPPRTETPPPPKYGDVVDGYAFIGGDPKDPKAWKTVAPKNVAQGKK